MGPVGGFLLICPAQRHHQCVPCARTGRHRNAAPGRRQPGAMSDDLDQYVIHGPRVGLRPYGLDDAEEFTAHAREP